VTWAQWAPSAVEAIERLAAEVARRRPDVVLSTRRCQASREPARHGRLLILASGPDRSHDAVDAVFEALGQRTLWLGPQHREQVEAGAQRLARVRRSRPPRGRRAGPSVSAFGTRFLRMRLTGGPLASSTALTKLAKMEQGDYSATSRWSGR